MVGFYCASYLSNNFEIFKNEVLKEMTSYYGEKYRDLFLERFDKINLIFYKNNRITKKNIFSYRIKDEIYDSDIEEFIKDKIKDNSIHLVSGYDFKNNKLYSYILFPINSSDRNLIHELIHAVMREPLFVIPEYNIYTEKCGLITDDNYGEVILEEIITEIDAENIYNNLLKRKYNKFINYHTKNINSKENSYYAEFLPLIKDFYNCYREQINYSRITLNKNNLFAYIDKNRFYKYMDYLVQFKVDLLESYRNKTLKKNIRINTE